MNLHVVVLVLSLIDDTKNIVNVTIDDLMVALDDSKYLEFREYFNTEGSSLGENFQNLFKTQIYIYRLKLLTILS